MSGYDPKVLGYLGRALSLELSAVQLYTTQARLLANWGLDEPARKLQGEAAEEMQQGGRVTYEYEYYGRETCGDMRGGPDVSLPSSHLTTEDLLEFFAEGFNFNKRESVAIMGAHTL